MKNKLHVLAVWGFLKFVVSNSKVWNNFCGFSLCLCLEIFYREGPAFTICFSSEPRCAFNFRSMGNRRYWSLFRLLFGSRVSVVSVNLGESQGLMRLTILKLPGAMGRSSSSHCHFSHRLRISSNLDLGFLFISLSRPERVWEEGGGGALIRQATSFHPAES